MQLSDIRNNEKFKSMGPDEQEEILDLYQQSVQDEAFAPGQLDMARYVQAQDEVRAAKAELNLQPDPRSTFQRMKDEFVNGMSSSMQAAKALRAVNGLDTPEEAAAELAEQERELQARPIARSMLKYQKTGGQGWVAPILNIFSNPEAAALITAQGLGSSIPGLAMGAAGSIGTRVAGGGKEAVLLSTMAGVGAGSAFVEGGSKILEDLREQAGDLQDTEAVAAILRDPAKLQEMKNRALARGVTVGAFDAASVALPSSMLFKTAKGLKGLAARGVGDAALQGMLGAAGEVAGSAVIGEESNPADAWAEFIGEMVPGMVELGLGGARTLIPQTEQAAQEKSKTNVLFPSQTSAPTIQADKQKGQRGTPRLPAGAVAKEAQKAANATAPGQPVNPGVDDALNGPEVVDVETLEGVGTSTGSSPEEKMPKPKSEGAFTYHGSGFGSFSSVAETLAEAQGIRRSGYKVATNQQEEEANSDFDTTANPDEADQKNIDNSDFVIVVGNNDTLKNDVGQARSRNYALDQGKTLIEGRSADVLIPRVLEHIKANPGQANFTIIGPQDTAVRTTGKNREALNREALDTAREVMQTLGSIPKDQASRDLNTEANARRKASGMDYARASSPGSIVAGLISPDKYTSRQESAQELLSEFDPAIEPTANDRVLVFGTDVAGRHDKVYGPIAQRLGAERGKTGAVGRTYALPIFDPSYKGPEGKDNRQGKGESFNPRSAKLEMQKFFEFAKQNPGKEFWLMFGAYPHTFSESQERAIFAGTQAPANVRFLGSTAANIFQGSIAPKSRVSVSRGKKSTRSASIPNVDRVLGEAQALDPNDLDKDVSIGDRIRNKGKRSLKGIILSERQARELLSAANAEKVERRREIVGTPKEGKIYNPAIAPGGITKLSSFPFTAFANSKKGTFLVRIKGVSEIGTEVDTQTAAERSQTNPQTIEAKNAIGKQYLVELDYVAPVASDYRRTISKIYERETEVVTQAKASGQVTQVDAASLLDSPQEAARPIGAQANLPGQVVISVEPEPNTTELENAKVALDNELKALQAREAEEFGSLSKDGGRNAPKKKGAINTEERKRVSDRIRELTLAVGNLENKIRAQRLDWLDSGIAKITEALIRSDGGVVIRNSPEWVKASVRELNAVFNSLVNPMDGSLSVYGVREDYDTDPAILGLSTTENKGSRKINDPKTSNKNTGTWYGTAPTTEMIEAKKDQAESSYMSQVFKGGLQFIVPNQDLAKHIGDVLLDNNPERMRTKSMPVLKTLTPQQITTLQDALNTINAFKPEAKPTLAAQKLVKEATNIVKEYAENENISDDVFSAIRDENTYALNQPGTYMKMLAKAIARDPRAGSLANLNLFLPGVGSVSFTPDQVQTFAKGELTGSVNPVAAKFTPADTTGLTEEGSLEKQFKPNSLYLYDNKGQVLRVLPFAFRHRFIPNAGGVNIVPDTDVMHPTTSLKAFDTREVSAQKSLTPEDLRDMSWAQARGLLGDLPSVEWRGKFALDVADKLSGGEPDKLVGGEPVVITDPDTVQFVLAYPGIFTGVIRHGDSIMVTEMKTAIGTITSEAPVAGLPQDFTNIFYRLLQPFFALQENEFNKDIELGSKEENNFGLKKTFAQSPDDIVGGGVGSVGDTVPAFSPTGETIPSVNKQLSEGERRFEEGLSDESIPETETQKGAGEVGRGMGGAEYNKLLEPTEGAKEVKSARLNMLISPEKAELIRKADPEGRYVRMVVLPRISYISRKTGKELPVTTKDGYAIVTGITDPRTGEYMGDKRPLLGRADSEIQVQDEKIEMATAVAAEQDKLGQYVFLPKGITIQDLVSTYQNILNVVKGANGPVLVSRDIIEFNQQLQALQNVVSFDATDDGIYITGAYDKTKGEWIGQLPYGARRMTSGEIASMTREQAVDLGNNINEWLREKRKAGVDALSLDDAAFSDDEIKNRVLLLQTVAQSYLDGFGKTRESLEKGLASMMSLKTREKQNFLFLENVEARLQQAINEGAFDADELRLLPRLIEDAVNVFNSGVVYSPVDTNDASKGWSAGAFRKFPNRSGRPREHFLSRVKKSGIPEQEANNLVDSLNINPTEAFKDSELMRRVFIETLLKSRTVEGAGLRADLDEILSEYEEMRDLYTDEYLNESRPTNKLYVLVSALSVEGYEGVDGLARRVVGIAGTMKINEQSFISLEGKTEEVKSGESVSSTFDAAFSPEEMGNDYEAQKGLAGEAYDTELDKYETLPTKDKRREKYEAFIRQMAKYRESLPFIQRAVHDIVMREGFGFTSGYRPSMYNGKSNAQLDILFPTVKLKEESQIGDAGKGKGFLSGKLLNSIFGALPGIPSSFIEPAVLSQIARERYEGIIQELVRNDMQEFSDAGKVREALRQYEQEVVDEQGRASQLRKDIKQVGIPISNKSTPEVVAMNLAANPKRVGALPKVLLNILGNSPLASLRDTSELLINRLRQQFKFTGTVREQLFEQLIDPVGKFDGTLAPEDLISPENDRARMRDILFNVLLPAFENRGSFDSASVLNQMRTINDPYRKQANISRVRKIQADVSGASKYATEEGFADAGVSFDLNLLNLQDPRQEQAMEYLRASARRKGLKNVRFQSNTAENYPVFTVRGSDNATDPVNSTIFVNPELLAEKLFQQKDINFLDPVARNTYDKLTEQLMDQLIAHEVAHLSYFEQLRREYRARFPNGGVSWEAYYNDRVRDAANFLRAEDNGLKVKLDGKKAVSVTEALGELYPETKQSDEVLVAEFLRLLLELDKSRGAKVFTEGLELQRSLQVQDRVSSLIRGQSRQQVMAMDEFARSQRKSFLGWLRTVLDSVFNLFSTLKASSDPRARELYTTYNKLSAIYDRFYSDYVAPPTVNTPTVEADGLFPMGEAFERARPIGAQRESAAAARRADLFENAGGVPTYTEKTSAEELAYLKNIGAIDAVESILNQLDADKVAVWLSYNPLPDTTAAVEIADQTFKLDNTQIFTLANYAITRFAETGQNHKATMLLRHVSKIGTGMGQTISIAYRLLKQFLMQSPSGMVVEYVSRLAETRGALKNKVGEQLSSLEEEVKQAQGEALGLTLNDAGVQALIKQINDLYGQALKQVNQDDLATIIRNHYAEFSGEELVSVLAKLLPEYENKPLLFELADMVQKNMQTQLGKALSLRGRTLRRNIVNRKGMNNAEMRAERIEQLIGEMHEVVKPPISKSGNTIEDAISGDARKILELAALGAINDDVVLSTIESLGKFPSFDVNTAETLRKMMVDASRTPYGFQRDRKFNEALKILHNATKSDAVPHVSAYWYMSMLSGPATFWMNFISTAIKAVADIATYSMAAAAARGNPALAIKYMTLGYKTFLASLSTIALAEAKGILLQGDINPRTNGKYVDAASINALESMGTDTLMKKVLSKGKYVFRIMSASDALFGRSAMEGFAAIQAQIQAIENVEGGITNLSIEEETARLLNQTDAFVEQATKQAIGENLKVGTPDFTKRVYELRDLAIQADPERATIMRRAEDLSLYSTYNNKPYGLLGHIAEGIGALSREHPILVPLFVPFTKIVSNVTNESINYTPIGAYRAFKAWKEAGAKTTSGLAKTVEQMEQIKKIEQGSLYAIQAVIGTSAMVVLAGLAGMLKDDDDDGQENGFAITGGGPSDPAARKQAREGGYVPYSFSFGGNSLKVSYLSTPLAIPLSIVGTWFDQSNYPRGRDKDMTEKVTSAALAVAQVPFNQSFLQGLSNLFKMLDGTSEGQDVSALQNFFSGAVGNVVPNLVKQADQIFEPIPQQQTSFVGKWLFNKIPILKSMTGKPQLNVLGEVVNAPAGPERLLFLQRFINTSEADPLFKLLMAKNAFIPDARRGQKIGNYPLNDEQFYKFRELRGKIIAQAVRRPSFFAMAKRMNVEQLDDYLTKLGQKATATAKARLTPELIRQGVKL
jgi:hypothetical protein